MLIVGMLAMGWNVARYGALTTGEVVSADFAVFSLAMLLIVAVYGGVTLLLAPLDYSWFERALVVLPVAMITHVLINARGHFVDRIMYGPVVSRLRARLSELATGVGLQPDAAAAAAQVVTSVDQLLLDAQRDLRNKALPRIESSTTPRDSMSGVAVDLEPLVSSALRRLNDLPALSRHPLLAALGDFVSGPTALDRAVKLRGELIQAIERLRPPDEALPKPGVSAGAGGWMHYVVLREAYVDGLPNRDIMQRYWIGEGSFYRAREAAIKTIAMDLAQRAGGHSLQ